MGKSPIYKRIKGRHGGALQMAELFKGPDHFLYVRSVLRVTEMYRRIAFKEITGLQIIRTANRALINVCLLILMTLFSVLGYSYWDNIGLAAFWIVLSLIPLVFMLINTLYGPTCRVYLFTRQRRHRLENFQRVRPARKFQQELLDMLALKPENVDEDEPISLRMAATRQLPVRTGAPTRLLIWTSVLFLVAAVVDGLWLLWTQPHLLYLKGVALAVGVGAVIYGTIHQRRLGENRPSSLWHISSLVFYLIEVGAIYVLCIPIYFASSVEGETTWQLLIRIVNAAQALPLPFYVLMMVSVFVQLALGVLGILAYRAGQEQV